ncbi:DUF4124 domain-containing protein [Acidovorax sp. LjRoot194]|uniref:DUF4124 domain-containing protein n=1 Tax=Acidovorax sp. LjRoot194 TaxID=3342280 RepID=UPI003ECF1E22
MTIRLHHLLLCLCAVTLGTAAQAQVLRCTDARTGKVTYTDGECAGGTAAREVEARKSPQELQQERELAAEALERKQQRLQSEATAAELDARRAAERDRAKAAQAAAAAPQPQDYARSAECARSRRNLDMVASGLSRSNYEQDVRLEAAQRQVDLDCLGPQGYAEVEKARANQPRVVVVPQRYPPVYQAPQPPPRLTQCGDFRCTDNQGNTYPRVGPGRFPGQGGVCRSNGGQAPC